jgi:hypothetical protein
MKVLKTIMMLLVTIICFSTVCAITETTFNNSLTTENLEYSNGLENVTRYLNIPKGSTITNASIDLIGLTGTEKNIEESYWCIGDVINCGSGADENFNTYAKNYNKNGGTGAYFENISIPSYINSINYTFKIYQYGGAAANDIYYWNNSAWQNIDIITTNSIYIQSELINTSNITTLQIRVNMSNCVGYCVGSGIEYFYEGKVVFNDDYVNNISVYINNTLVYENVSEISSLINNIDLNSSLLTDYFANSGSIEFDFYSQQIGYLNYSNLLINYTPPSNSAVLSFDNGLQNWISSVNSGTEINLETRINNAGDWNATECEVYMPGYSGFSINFNNITAGSHQNATITITPTSSIAGNLKIACKGTDENATIYTTNFITTAISVATPGGGGGGFIGDCEIFLYKPRKGSLIGILGGYETEKCAEFYFYNNHTGSTTFNIDTNLDNCYVDEKQITSEAGSLEKNQICCEIPLDREEGNVIISTLSCKESYNVYTDKSQVIGFIDLFLGSQGILAMGVVWVIFIVLILGTLALLNMGGVL